jgi:enoyl-[acyl-carrier-protein] reductase (NADH)
MESEDWRYLLHNKIVFITGAAGWIARHIVKACYEHGAYIVIGDINLDEANKLKTEISEQYKTGNKENRLFVVSLDVTDENSIQQAVKLTVKKWKTIDVLINTYVKKNVFFYSYLFFSKTLVRQYLIWLILKKVLANNGIVRVMLIYVVML